MCSKADDISAYHCALTPLELGSLLRGGDIFGVIYWWISVDTVCLSVFLVGKDWTVTSCTTLINVSTPVSAGYVV